MTIPARVSIVTIGAHDLAKLKTFYAGLGWRQIADFPTYASFETGGAVLALFPYGELAQDGRVAAPPASDAFRGVTFALNVEERGMVDRVLDEVRAAGGRITKEPEDAVWGGRSSYFADPEGNLWEVVWAPGTSFDERGAIVMGEQ